MRTASVLMILLILGIAVRLGEGWMHPSDLTADNDGYLAHADMVANGEGFAGPYSHRPTAFRPPAYPIALAALRVPGLPDCSLCGDHQWIVQYRHSLAHMDPLPTNSVVAAGFAHRDSDDNFRSAAGSLHNPADDRGPGGSNADGSDCGIECRRTAARCVDGSRRAISYSGGHIFWSGIARAANSAGHVRDADFSQTDHACEGRREFPQQHHSCDFADDRSRRRHFAVDHSKCGAVSESSFPQQRTVATRSPWETIRNSIAMSSTATFRFRGQGHNWMHGSSA